MYYINAQIFITDDSTAERSALRTVFPAARLLLKADFLSMKKQNVWKKNNLSIQNKTDAKIKSSDEFAEKAEKLRDVTVIAKSNSLRCTAKDKELD